MNHGCGVVAVECGAGDLVVVMKNWGFCGEGEGEWEGRREEGELAEEKRNRCRLSKD